jgi:CubicO group peptidase (beta-lactamase class C family)
MLAGHEPDGNTQYRIGSLTKMFVAVLIMRLRGRGSLVGADLGRAAARAGQRPRGASAPPGGRRFHYSNPGYALLGALAGELRGRVWHEVLRREILEPLGMARTTIAPQAPHARGFWYWGPRPYLLRLLDDALELSPVSGNGRASRFRAEPDGTWTGLDGYYPAGARPDAPLAARPGGGVRALGCSRVPLAYFAGLIPSAVVPVCATMTGCSLVRWPAKRSWWIRASRLIGCMAVPLFHH